MYFRQTKATLTELRRNTSRVVEAADRGEEVILTEHGQPKYRLERIREIDWKAALALLKEMGPINLPPRK